jgi:hypothetical protein
VKGKEFSLSLSFQTGSANVAFGAYSAIMVSGDYYVADPLHPLRGLLGGRNSKGPQQIEIVGPPGARDKLHVLIKLHERGVTGSRPKRARGLADFGQTIQLFGGKFTREEDARKCLGLEWFRVGFPLTIWRKAKDGTPYAEVHFGMKSIFPDGIEFEGKTLDLKVFEEWNSSLRLGPPNSSDCRNGSPADAGERSEDRDRPKPESQGNAR